jgi:hypothetical protein
MYRFGDGTPFPIQENFIETLLAAVDACVGTFAAAAEIEDRREKTRVARKEAEDELRKVDLMEKAIEQAVAPMMPSVDRAASPSSQTAARALAAARTTIGSNRTLIQQRLQQLASEPRTEGALQRSRVALGAFFERHEMPDAAWRWSWSSTPARTQGEAMALAGRFRAHFELDLDGPWKSVVRVGAIAPGLQALVTRKKAFGGMKRVKISLDRCGIVAVECAPERHVLVLREHASKPSPGWRVLVQDPERSGVTLVAIDLGGRTMGPEIVLDGDNGLPFQRLWEAIECDFDEMRADRRRLSELHIGDATLESVGDPAMIGRTILGVLGPIVRQIRTRSRVPGELAIKLDVADGRREELYVSRADVERRFATLPAMFRRPFEDIGLGRQATAEIVSSDDAQTIPEVAPRQHTLGKLPAVPPTPIPRPPLRVVV